MLISDKLQCFEKLYSGKDLRVIALFRRLNLFPRNHTMLKDGREVMTGDGKARTPGTPTSVDLDNIYHVVLFKVFKASHEQEFYFTCT